jgi:hypothetical protein
MCISTSYFLLNLGLRNLKIFSFSKRKYESISLLPHQRYRSCSSGPSWCNSAGNILRGVQTMAHLIVRFCPASFRIVSLTNKCSSKHLVLKHIHPGTFPWSKRPDYKPLRKDKNVYWSASRGCSPGGFIEFSRENFMMCTSNIPRVVQYSRF